MRFKTTGIAAMLCLVQGIVFSQAVIHNPNLSDDRYRNPIIHADYSDPDVIRVGEDYYLTASSFSHFPGLPILHSKDLVNWTIIGHAALTYPDTSFRLPQHGNAIWAPSIRHHNGNYYIYYGDPDRGVFMTKATNPAGPWSPLKLIKKVTGWIDCCPLWDEDGKAYLVHAYANSRVGLKSVLLVNEMNPNGEEILGTSTLVFNGQQNHNTIEGPKFYQRNGYYYIFAPAGGVATGWQTILRSKTPFGPYEEKIVLEQGSTKINGPHQGGWITGADGREWFMHFQDKGAYGRIIHLQPMRWVNDWPEMGQDYDGNGVGEPVAEFAKPVLSQAAAVPQTSDEFNDKQLGLQWQWQANVVPTWSTLTNGQLRLQGVAQVDPRSIWMQPNLLLQKFPAENFSATTKLKLAPQGGKAGLTVFGLDYASLQIEYLPSKKYSISLRTCKDADKGTTEAKGSADVSIASPEVYFRVEVRKVQPSITDPVRAVCQFFYSLDGAKFTAIGAPFTAREGKWVGAKVGLFNTGKKGTYADFDWFRIVEL